MKQRLRKSLKVTRCTPSSPRLFKQLAVARERRGSDWLSYLKTWREVQGCSFCESSSLTKEPGTQWWFDSTVFYISYIFNINKLGNTILILSGVCGILYHGDEYKTISTPVQKTIGNPTENKPLTFQKRNIAQSYQVAEAIPATQRCDSAWEFFK